ncbi:hypothetical protein [Arsenophonus nasoniae]|uniref:Uncharacterized protein n=1 Tax=Arsenophonus nasoniae TaxID=638 RepID=A0A4P7L716_9GAMM|nr:hypothetical protein [Arsenophonus nasoniae]QBY46790.1 hypothetical protein ArsFIN_54010 [Arsenophonus nasoniae]
MARNKSPRKRKPVKSGRLPVTSRATAPVYPKRFMISLPPENDDDRPPEFFYDTLKEAIRHCVRLGPQFFLDTQYYPPLVTIIRVLNNAKTKPMTLDTTTLRGNN